MLALAGVAQAHEIKPSWGYAFIDESPFNDPAAGGALLPTTQVFPRGHIRDTVVDGRDVRLTVLVFTPGNPGSQDRYSIDEGDFQDIKIDRRLDIKPFQVSYLAYDFCRFNPSNGVVEVCEERYRIGRPADATPTPTPTPGGPTGSPLRPPTPTVTASRSPPTAGIRTPPSTRGPRRSRATGSTTTAPAATRRRRSSATIRGKWKAKNGRVWVNTLSVLDAPQGALVEVTCGGEALPVQAPHDDGQRQGQRLPGEVLQAQAAAEDHDRRARHLPEHDRPRRPLQHQDRRRPEHAAPVRAAG